MSVRFQADGYAGSSVGGLRHASYMHQSDADFNPVAWGSSVQLAN
jgi:hypothetical protein